MKKIIVTLVLILILSGVKALDFRVLDSYLYYPSTKKMVNIENPFVIQVQKDYINIDRLFFYIIKAGQFNSNTIYYKTYNEDSDRIFEIFVSIEKFPLIMTVVINDKLFTTYALEKF